MFTRQIRYVLNSFLYIRLFLSPGTRVPERTVYIELLKVSKGMIRRLAQIYLLFKNSGYTCSVYIPFRTFVKLKNFLYITREKEFNLVRRSYKNQSKIVVSDLGDYTKKSVYIDYSVFTKKIDTDGNIFYPIGFHPDIMSVAIEKKVLLKSGNAQRKIGVLFAGNINQKKYSDPRTKEYFRIHTRYEIIQDIKDNISTSVIYCPDSYEDLIEKMKSGRLIHKIVLVDSSVSPIPQDQWLSILGETTFFLHTPGILYPWCHNQIESMAAGAIPLTQFPHIFHPSLENGKNCFSWSDFTELHEILRAVTENSVSREKIELLRSGTNKYYRKHFSFSSFNRKLKEFINDSGRNNMRMFICAGEHSMNISDNT